MKYINRTGINVVSRDSIINILDFLNIVDIHILRSVNSELNRLCKPYCKENVREEPIFRLRRADDCCVCNDLQFLNELLKDCNYITRCEKYTFCSTVVYSKKDELKIFIRRLKGYKILTFQKTEKDLDLSRNILLIHR